VSFLGNATGNRPENGRQKSRGVAAPRPWMFRHASRTVPNIPPKAVDFNTLQRSNPGSELADGKQAAMLLHRVAVGHAGNVVRRGPLDAPAVPPWPGTGAAAGADRRRKRRTGHGSRAAPWRHAQHLEMPVEVLAQEALECAVLLRIAAVKPISSGARAHPPAFSAAGCCDTPRDSASRSVTWASIMRRMVSCTRRRPAMEGNSAETSAAWRANSDTSCNCSSVSTPERNPSSTSWLL
jgi:hypothetical protein